MSVGTLALAGMAWRASVTGVFNAGHGAEYEAWHSWPDGRGPIACIQSAILGASAHNTQPWQFAVTGDAITVYADYQRHLGSFDPLRR